VILIQLDKFEDERGLFFELYHSRKYAQAAITGPFVQDNFSRSSRGTVRGLHYQLRHPQGKLITVLEGTAFDVAVDIRRGSPTFRQWLGTELSADSGQQLYIAPGFAHGFCALSETVALSYKCTDFYAPHDERGIIWNDPTIGIVWPATNPLLSPKDRAYRRLQDMMDELPQYQEGDG
jgi:dTDP-4-dehydrorhamnose 3,5-epimerase